MRRNVIYILLAFAGFACNPDDNEIAFPKELVAIAEEINTKLWVAGVEVNNAPDAETVFSENERGLNFYYIIFKNETNLLLALKDGLDEDTTTVEYKFLNDSLMLYSNYYFEEGKFYLGNGNYESITGERSAVMYYGYRKNDVGQIIDLNEDMLININDKIHFIAQYDKSMSADDVAKTVGYNAASELEANDTIMIYNYSLSFLKDYNGDRIINEMDE